MELLDVDHELLVLVESSWNRTKKMWGGTGMVGGAGMGRGRGWVGEMAQQLALNALPEDPDSIPSFEQITTPILKDLMFFSDHDGQ